MQVYLDNCAYKIGNNQMIYYLNDNVFETNEDHILQILYYDGIGIGKGIDPAKSSDNKEYMVCHYWLFNHGFKFQNYVSRLLSSLQKVLIIVVLFITLANLVQRIY